ncbi:MAG: protein kinase, partial [Candidatus Magnetominusculus sp. LBB02]|nr:protein kinase [Candidatus Magnetominusculus sp. LBB02]
MRANLPRAERGLWKKNSVIDNRYEVRGLARGGMGEVYFVFDREIGRMVAVKTPLPSVMENHDGLNRFYREAEAWISLGTHPNICSAYYVAELDGLPRLFIEYVDAGALDKWLREGTLSTFTEKLDMA